MIEGYYEFDSRKMEMEFPVLSRSVEEVGSFTAYLKHIDGEFIQLINGKGDAFSYVSGQPIQIINVRLKNKKNEEWISFKIHEHWHKIVFEEVVKQELPRILKKHSELENDKMYLIDTPFIGKIFKFIDENANTFKFFVFMGEWADCYPVYNILLKRFSSIIKSYYYTIEDFEHWEYLKELDFWKIKVKIK